MSDLKSLAVEDASLTVEGITLVVQNPSLTVEGTSLAVEHPSLTVAEASLTVEGASLIVEDASLAVAAVLLAVEMPSLARYLTSPLSDDTSPAVELKFPTREAILRLYVYRSYTGASVCRMRFMICAVNQCLPPRPPCCSSVT